MHPLVTADWLAANRSAVRIVDVRWYLDGRSGRAAYEAAHIPEAVWVDLDTDLSEPATAAAGRHPLATPARFAAAMRRIGVGDRTPVVAYDDNGGMVAARLWWMLHVLDHPVAVLDGGLQAWSGERRAGWETAEPVHFTERPWPSDRFVDADGLRGVELVLDARTAERFAHGDPAVDPRPGHVPGARSAPWQGNLTEGRLHDAATLRARYDAFGAQDAERVAVYCGSGVSACHDLLALELAGYGHRTALYPGSWSQWGADPDRPADTGNPA
jgi:thiosulfate/3-mercaptopyruvate sulfurtransferase